MACLYYHLFNLSTFLFVVRCYLNSWKDVTWFGGFHHIPIQTHFKIYCIEIRITRSMCFFGHYLFKNDWKKSKCIYSRREEPVPCETPNFLSLLVKEKNSNFLYPPSPLPRPTGKCVLCYATQERLICVQLWGGGQCMQYQPGKFFRWVWEKRAPHITGQVIAWRCGKQASY